MKLYRLVIQDEKVLTNFDLNEYARLGIGNFQGVFMRDTLPITSSRKPLGVLFQRGKGANIF